jgi:hypothetical protein
MILLPPYNIPGQEPRNLCSWKQIMASSPKHCLVAPAVHRACKGGLWDKQFSALYASPIHGFSSRRRCTNFITCSRVLTTPHNCMSAFEGLKALAASPSYRPSLVNRSSKEPSISLPHLACNQILSGISKMQEIFFGYLLEQTYSLSDDICCSRCHYLHRERNSCESVSQYLFRPRAHHLNSTDILVHLIRV